MDASGAYAAIVAGGKITFTGGTIAIGPDATAVVTVKADSPGQVVVNGATIDGGAKEGITGTGTLTIAAGEVKNSGNKKSAIAFGTGTVYMTGGKVTTVGSESVAIVCNGAVEVSGGEITTSGTNAHAIKSAAGTVAVSGEATMKANGTNGIGIYSTGTSRVTIDGGDITGTWVVKAIDTTNVSVSNGKLNGTSSVFATSGTPTISVSGGYFSRKVADTYLADGKYNLTVPNGYPLPLRVGDAVAQIGNDYYGSIVDAITVAEAYFEVHGDYPVVAVLDPEAIVPEGFPDWKIENGRLVHV